MCDLGEISGPFNRQRQGGTGEAEAYKASCRQPRRLSCGLRRCGNRAGRSDAPCPSASVAPSNRNPAGISLDVRSETRRQEHPTLALARTCHHRLFRNILRSPGESPARATPARVPPLRLIPAIILESRSVRQVSRLLRNVAIYGNKLAQSVLPVIGDHAAAYPDRLR